MKRLRLLLFSLICMAAADAAGQTETPSNLDQAIAYFQRNWTNTELDSFRHAPENEAVVHQHFGTGAWIRDTWIRGGAPLAAYFDSLGIRHADDMSSIVMRSLHRALNKKDLQLAKQVAGYRDYWAAVDSCDDKLKATALAAFNRLNDGDSVTILFPVDTAYGRRNAVVYNCPRPEWKFDPAKDLIVKGTIVRKYTVNDPTNVYLEVQIASMSRPDTPILMEQVKVGGTKRLALYALRIE